MHYRQHFCDLVVNQCFAATSTIGWSWVAITGPWMVAITGPWMFAIVRPRVFAIAGPRVVAIAD